MREVTIEALGVYRTEEDDSKSSCPIPLIACRHPRNQIWTNGRESIYDPYHEPTIYTVIYSWLIVNTRVVLAQTANAPSVRPPSGQASISVGLAQSANTPFVNRASTSVVLAQSANTRLVDRASTSVVLAQSANTPLVDRASICVGLAQSVNASFADWASTLSG